MPMQVHFQPEAWVNDYAIAVDDEGEDIWVVTDETAARVFEAVAADGGVDLDFAREDDNTPEWVREWSGPFTITVVEEN